MFPRSTSLPEPEGFFDFINLESGSSLSHIVFINGFIVRIHTEPQTHPRQLSFMSQKRGSRSGSPQHKRQKVTHDAGRPSSPSAHPDGAKKAEAGLCAENLATGLLNEENVARLRQEYATNKPFKYAKVETLFRDDLLKKVKDECLTHLSFTEKETDIYRVCASIMRFTIPSPSFFGLYVLRFPRIPASGGEESRFSVLTSGPTSLLYPFPHFFVFSIWSPMPER